MTPRPAILAAALLCLSGASAYSFLSCSNYDQVAQQCNGYARKYSQWVEAASHAYDLEADLPANTNQNTTSVDPLLQNRTLPMTASAIQSPQYPTVDLAYGAYPMASALPGQQLTLTWPRTAEPDGDPVTSPFAWVYYNPNSTVNSGLLFNQSVDPTLPQFQQNQLAQLTYNAVNGVYGNCPVTDDSQKYDLTMHCSGQITVPANLTQGVYTFLWYWAIHQPALYRLYPIVFEVNVLAPVTAAPAPAPGLAAARSPTTSPVATAGR